MKLRIALVISLILAFFAEQPVMVQAAGNWWNTDWLYREKITFSMDSIISENLSDFPITIELTDTNFDYSKAQVDGDDIRFVDSDNVTVLDYEFDSEYLNSGTNIIYVKIPQLDDSDIDYIYIYYGNNEASSGENKNATWSNSYMAVYHMQDYTTSAIVDSVHDLIGSKVAENQPLGNSGYIGGYQYFDGINDQIVTPHDDYLNQVCVTIEAIIKPDSSGTDGYILAKGNPGSGIYYNLRFIGSINRIEWAGTSAVQSDAVFTDTDWVYISLVCDDANLAFYHNGDSAGTGILTFAPSSNTDGLYFGNRLGGTTSSVYFDGDITEIRLSFAPRSQSWLKATYETTINNSSYLTFSPLEGIPQPPINITAQLDGNNIVLNWELGYLATGVKIVKGINHCPASPSDGEIVYEGTGLTYTELESDVSTFCYAFFGTSAWGDSIDYTDISIGGSGMVFIGMLAFGAILTALSWRRRNIALSMAASLVWLAMAFWFILGDSAPFAITDSWGIIITAVLIIMAFIPLLTFMDNPVVRNAGGRSWTEYKSDRDLRRYEEKELSPYENYRAGLRKRLASGRNQRRF